MSAAPYTVTELWEGDAEFSVQCEQFLQQCDFRNTKMKTKMAKKTRK